MEFNCLEVKTQELGDLVSGQWYWYPVTITTRSNLCWLQFLDTFKWHQLSLTLDDNLTCNTLSAVFCGITICLNQPTYNHFCLHPAGCINSNNSKTIEKLQRPHLNKSCEWHWMIGIVLNVLFVILHFKIITSAAQKDVRNKFKQSCKQTSFFQSGSLKLAGYHYKDNKYYENTQANAQQNHFSCLPCLPSTKAITWTCDKNLSIKLRAWYYQAEKSEVIKVNQWLFNFTATAWSRITKP